ncbi:uncharacterized protein EAE98_002473 [Botrytis deweyae]|uniref:Cytochrome P450 n=1 Tax=Botrytis deweyae TaxID=2478750 RepID=A0ABQ7IXD7_9HELO|nr:uncharacterized protein EAE98_002473 [Botrytis deweyae]KAF7936254.1 hypothetical protein EAE98_002473 [Botrytis deweyae]
MGFILICIFILVLILGFTTKWRYSVSTFFGAILAIVYKIVDSQGQKIPGPSWEWPHGQFVDKFIDGKSKSSLWYGYGPVYRIWCRTIPEVVLTSSIDMKEFYSDARVHEKSRSSNGGWYFHQILGDCLGLINGSRHRRLRNIFESHFTRRAVAHRYSDMNDYSLSFLQSISPTEGNESSVLHASSAFMKYPLLCTAEIIYGPMEGGEKNELCEIGPGRLNLMRYVLSYTSFCTGITAIYELSNFKRRWKDFNAKMAGTRGISSPSTPIVTAWRSIERKEVTENEVLQTLDEMLFTNLDVTTNALTWLIILLGEITECQSKLRNEIHDSIDIEAYCNRRDTFLHFCFLETLRVRPIAAFTMPESSPMDKVLGGFLVRPGTSVTIDTLQINNGKEFWGSDSADFRPERFADIDRSALKYNFFTWGFGNRDCLGQHLAELSIKIMVANLVKGYEVTICEAQKSDGEFRLAKNSWVPLSDVHIRISKL